MASFKEYLSESTLLVEAKVHLTHIEDAVLDDGYNGAKAAIAHLEGVAGMLMGHSDQSTMVTTKWDGCIHPDTLLVTNKGNIPIVDIIQSSESYQVLQYNFTTNENELEEIQLPRINNNNKDWVEVHLENGDILRTTTDHKFYTTNRGWVEAQDLTEEDDIKESE